ncbi:hypothetical protein AKJ16_DCAP02119 [Drosera capensis]
MNNDLDIPVMNMMLSECDFSEENRHMINKLNGTAQASGPNVKPKPNLNGPSANTLGRSPGPKCEEGRVLRPHFLEEREWTVSAAAMVGVGAFLGTRVMEIVKKHDSGGLVWKRIKLTTTRRANAKKRLLRVWQNEAVLKACSGQAATEAKVSNVDGASNMETITNSNKTVRLQMLQGTRVH